MSKDPARKSTDRLALSSAGNGKGTVRHKSANRTPSAKAPGRGGHEPAGSGTRPKANDLTPPGRDRGRGTPGNAANQTTPGHHNLAGRGTRGNSANQQTTPSRHNLAGRGTRGNSANQQTTPSRHNLAGRGTQYQPNDLRRTPPGRGIISPGENGRGEQGRKPNVDDLWKAVHDLTKNVSALSRTVQVNQEETRETTKQIIDMIEDQNQTQPQAIPATPGTPKKMPRALPGEAKRIYRGLGEDMTYNGQAKFMGDQHNEEVTRRITEAIKDGDVPYRDSHIKKACRNIHNNLRRREKSERDGTLAVNQDKSKRGNRRTRLRDLRATVGKDCLTPAELEFLSVAKPDLMSDEETDEEQPNTWLVRRPAWRCKKLTQIVDRCQPGVDKLVMKSRKLRNRRVMTDQPSRRSIPDTVDKVYLDVGGGEEVVQSEEVMQGEEVVQSEEEEQGEEVVQSEEEEQGEEEEHYEEEDLEDNEGTSGDESEMSSEEETSMRSVSD
ncbi:Hypp9711 [Branchiostoma lanceolatum]|uniref:Hypp9711 protein n=1 Tax=Branchiostoma lanceolatum TaxID=7740 RepID=A0A8S4MP27_BRALA|nr:Hypp9711 [Branchiostoma lanceolatum]